jgi:hypothetical protein
MIFLADGRIGNQIFQYLFLKTIQDKNEKIVISGFEELREIFDGFELLEEKYQYGLKMYNNYEKCKGFGTGMYMFKKRKYN